MLYPNHPWAGVESVRRLSTVGVGISGSTTPCWSNLSGLTSTKGSVPQLLPPEKRKVGGSIPPLATGVDAGHGFFDCLNARSDPSQLTVYPPGPELTARGWCQATLGAGQLSPNH